MAMPTISSHTDVFETSVEQMLESYSAYMSTFKVAPHTFAAVTLELSTPHLNFEVFDRGVVPLQAAQMDALVGLLSGSAREYGLSQSAHVAQKRKSGGYSVVGRVCEVFAGRHFVLAIESSYTTYIVVHNLCNHTPSLNAHIRVELMSPIMVYRE